MFKHINPNHNYTFKYLNSINKKRKIIVINLIWLYQPARYLIPNFFQEYTNYFNTGFISNLLDLNSEIYEVNNFDSVGNNIITSCIIIRYNSYIQFFVLHIEQAPYKF